MKLLIDLLSISSLSGSEQKIAKYIYNHIKSLGFSPTYIEGNVVIKVQGESSKQVVIFDAHMDTVSPGEESLWNGNPLKGVVSGDKIYGLGASDNKSSIASLLLLIKQFVKKKPPCDAWFAFVVNEEVDGSGSKNFVRWFSEKHLLNYEKACAVVMEPTSLKKIEIGHRGNVFIKVSIQGKSGHGACPLPIHENAVLLSSQACLALHSLNDVWKKDFENDFFGAPSIGVGTSISGGSNDQINKFSDTCTFTADIRTTPKMHKRALGLIQEALKDIPAKVSLARKPAPFGSTEINDDVVSSMKTIFPEASICTSPWSTDQCFFSQKNIPTVVLGPGEPSVIHKANEYCHISKVNSCAILLNSFIFEWCSKVALTGETK